MDLEGEKAAQNGICKRPAQAPLCWFGADPVERSETFLVVEVLSETAELTRLFFLWGPPAVALQLQSKHRTQAKEVTHTNGNSLAHTAICPMSG